MIAILGSISIVLGSVLFWLTTTAYNNAMFDDYGRIGKSYLDAATVLVEAEELKKITAPGGNLTPEYQEVSERLESFYGQSEEFVSYLYIYQFYIDENGTYMVRVIYDSDPEGDEYGVTFSMDEDYAAEKETKLMDPNNQEVVGPMVTIGNWGWLISVYHPINDADGSVLAYMCVDIDVNNVVVQTQKLRVALLVIQLSFLVVFVLSVYIFFRLYVVGSLHKLERAANTFKETKRKSYSPKDIIKSKDEFGELYAAFDEMQNVIIQDRAKLEEYLARIKVMAYQDELTGVKNLTSYDQKAEELEAKIKDGTARFAIVMVDMNGLKAVNDRCGHGQGNTALKVTSKVICDTFKHSPVYRMGGDEFTAILENDDYDNRDVLVAELRKGEVKRDMDKKAPWNQFAVAIGCAVFDPKIHPSVKSVFDEADKEMYDHKKELGGR